MSLKSQLESLLFVAVKPLSLKDLSTLTNEKTTIIEQALNELSTDYVQAGRGLTIVQHNHQYQLGSAGANAAIVQKFFQDETGGELSQPSLEALTIIAYRGPLAKLELERIRGVNCSLIIRNLLLRGLIEEKNDKGKEEFFYSVTHDFMRFLGLTTIKDLPDYEHLHNLDIWNLTTESTPAN